MTAVEGQRRRGRGRGRGRRGMDIYCLWHHFFSIWRPDDLRTGGDGGREGKERTRKEDRGGGGQEGPFSLSLWTRLFFSGKFSSSLATHKQQDRPPFPQLHNTQMPPPFFSRILHLVFLPRFVKSAVVVQKSEGPRRSCGQGRMEGGGGGIRR